MNKPKATFRNELKAFEQERLPTYIPAAQDIACRVLGRWGSRHDWQEVWVMLRPLLPAQMSDVDFIGAVIEARLDAEVLSHIIHDMPGLEKKVHKRARDHLRHRNHVALSFEAGLLANIRHKRDRILGREKTDPRLQFMKRLSDGFQQWCGQPLDGAVKVLTEIAFDRETTTEAVRKARQQRTTRPQK
jgi:hypothetical protein